MEYCQCSFKPGTIIETVSLGFPVHRVCGGVIFPPASQETRIAELERVLDEARLQIEYLHEKFSTTGSGVSVLRRIKFVLGRKNDRA